MNFTAKSHITANEIYIFMNDTMLKFNVQKQCNPCVSSPKENNFVSEGLLLDKQKLFLLNLPNVSKGTGHRWHQTADKIDRHKGEFGIYVVRSA